MDLPKGFNREVVEASESNPIDFTEKSIRTNIDVYPLKSGGSNFKTHKLVQKSSSKYTYQPSTGGALFSLIFVIIGLVIITISIISFINLSFILTLDNLFMFVLGLIFGSAGCFLYYRINMPRVFDKQTGLYYKAYKVDIHKNKNSSEKQLLLKSIIALQIIGETEKLLH